MFLAICMRIYALRNERGAAAVEYGLIVALIALAIAIGAEVLGTGLSNMFNDIGAYVDGVGTP